VGGAKVWASDSTQALRDELRAVELAPDDDFAEARDG
jgi:hypothetical protein